MVILKLLSEEIFDFSAEQMTQAKIKNLKNQMCGEFAEIFQLCIEVLDKAQKPSLIKATLETMLRFLNWIPLGYIFETKLIDTLTERVSTPLRLILVPDPIIEPVLVPGGPRFPQRDTQVLVRSGGACCWC